MTERLLEILTDYVDIDPSEISEKTDIRADLGMDSLQLANFAEQVEEEFGVAISDRDAMNLRTVGDVLALLEE